MLKHAASLSFKRHFSGAPDSLLTTAVEAVTSLLASISGQKKDNFSKEEPTQHQLEKDGIARRIICIQLSFKILCGYSSQLHTGSMNVEVDDSLRKSQLFYGKFQCYIDIPFPVISEISSPLTTPSHSKKVVAFHGPSIFGTNSPTESTDVFQPQSLQIDRSKSVHLLANQKIGISQLLYSSQLVMARPTPA